MRFNPFTLLQKIGLTYFVMFLLCAILLAWVLPDIGKSHATFSLGNIASWGLCLIFFFYGLRLDFENIKKGLSNFKLHILVQFGTFVIFPVIGFFIYKLFANETNQNLLLGIFFLCALPSTVSSSVVLVAIAKGNIPAAIFNASISGIIGVFLTPTLMTLVVVTSSVSMELGSVLLKLILQVLLPVILGACLNFKFGKWAIKNKKFFTLYDQTIILLIVYTSFCDSFANRMFTGLSYTSIIILCLAMIALFFAVYGIIFAITKLLNFEKADTITALFCGSKKSLAHGAVMSKIIFANSNILGIIILPTMIYHALQLVIVSILAKKAQK